MRGSKRHSFESAKGLTPYCVASMRSSEIQLKPFEIKHFGPKIPTTKRFFARMRTNFEFAGFVRRDLLARSFRQYPTGTNLTAWHPTKNYPISLKTSKDGLSSKPSMRFGATN